MSQPFRVPVVPVSYFSIVLGLAGLGGAWRVGARVWGLPAAVGEILMALGALVWLLLVFSYVLKWLFAREAAKAELFHAVQCCFVGLAGVTTMLVAGGVLPYSRMAAVILFAFGVIFTFAFGAWRTGLLWQGDRELTATTPILLLTTAAGSFVSATIVSALGYPDWGQLAFGAGLFSWLAIESVLIHRLYTAPALASALRPTLGILLAPPTVGGVAYLSVTSGAPDWFAHALFGYGLLEALILLRLIPWIAKQPFTPGYWAFTFGTAALATSAARMVERGEANGAMATLAPYVFGAATAVIGLIALLTLRLILIGRFLPPPALAPTLPATAPAAR